MQHFKQIFFAENFNFFAKTPLQRSRKPILYCKKIFLKRVFSSKKHLVPKQCTSIHAYTIVLINSHTSQLSLFFSFFFFLFCFSLPRETGIPYFLFYLWLYLLILSSSIYSRISCNTHIHTHTHIRIMHLCMQKQISIHESRISNLSRIKYQESRTESRQLIGNQYRFNTPEKICLFTQANPMSNFDVQFSVSNMRNQESKGENSTLN